MIFTVYADKAEEVSKRLNKLAKKAARYNVPFSYTISDEHPETVNVFDDFSHKAGSYKVAAVDFDIACEELIKANGWTVLAKVEHGDKGNVVSCFGKQKARAEWFTAAPHCDHCNTNRQRAVTFFIENAEGDTRQVGRACLHDYTGISPATAALWAEVRDLFPEDLDCSMTDWNTRRGAQMFEVRQILACAYDAIQEYGYRKSDEQDSTREVVLDKLREQVAASDKAMSQAELINSWLLGIDFDSASDLERNCSVFAKGEYVTAKQVGRLAYMPLAYEHYMECKAREEQRANTENTSAYVGEVGTRLTLDLTAAVLLTSWYNDFGTTYLYKFADEAGNVFIWYASRPIELQERMTLKATIKAHNERNGVKQTVLTRCKVVA